jgi:outer membrane putative beta-barrel porin/alpha-amylase
VPEENPNRYVFAIVCCFAITAACSQAIADECAAPSSEIATDRPDVTNSSLTVPAGSLQIENGMNTTGGSAGKTFDGTNTRLRFGIAPCLEVLADLPTYLGRLGGAPATGFSDFSPAVKWQFSSLPEHWSLSITAGAGLPTGATAVAGVGVQPYLQFPWSHDLGDGWASNGMLTEFFSASDPINRYTTEATLTLEKRVTSRMDLFAEYVGDYRAVGASTQLFNVGGGYLLTDTQQIDAHIAVGLNRNSPNYVIGVGYSVRFDNVLR